MHVPSLKPLSSLGLASALGVLTLTLACTSSDNKTDTPQNSTVNVAPAISTQPVGTTVKVGDPVTLTVKATGTPAPTYQWAKGGTPISGATTDTLSIAKAQASDDGSYTVVVTNSVGSVTSSAAVVVVNYAPTITTQPKDLTVSAGNEAAFTVAADGKPAPTFQWKRNGNAITGATAATYKFNTTPGDDGFNFTVDVTNSLGTVTSTPAKLTVTTATTTKPAITTDLVDVTVDEGKDATFKVVASGSNPLTYTWFVNGAQVATGTNATYTLTAAKVADTGKLVKVTVTNPAGSVTSKEVKLTVKPAAPVGLKDGGAEWFEDATQGVAAPKDGDVIDENRLLAAHFHSAIGWEQDSKGSAYYGFAVDKLDGKDPYQGYWSSQDPTKVDPVVGFKIAFVTKLGCVSGQKVRIGLWGAPKGATADVFSGWVTITVK